VWIKWAGRVTRVGKMVECNKYTVYSNQNINSETNESDNMGDTGLDGSITL